MGNQFKRLLKSLAYFIKLKVFALFAILLGGSFVFLSVNLLSGIYSFQVFFSHLTVYFLLLFLFRERLPWDRYMKRVSRVRNKS